ncbi:hypothetical protein SAMN05444145_105238 [Alistipes timonensis JC136]|uniref:Phage tail tube protein n=1 Tax=Alistipes timonensis JC136 TaxID=1033731 RepID=A0A1H4DCZ2_9BACT|nr:hypothetical protein [Alistipes timonensis]SEA70594.1 hypothetical protein SAMN05444145_105238 [Alistipes timonensis JC136]
MFDSRQYEFADTTLFLGNRDVTGLRAINYTEKQEKEALYGKGNKPLSIQKGNKSYEGSIGILQSELEALEVAGGGSILDLELTAVVNYGNPSKGDVIKTDELIGVQFTEAPRGMKQGDKFMEIELPIVFLDRKPIL